MNTEQNGYFIPTNAPRDAYGNLIPPQAPAIPTPLKPAYEVKPHDRIFAWASLPLGFLFVRYALVHTNGYLTTAVFLLLHLLSLLYIRRCGCRPQGSHRLLGAVLAAFTLVFSLTASSLLHALCFVFLLAGELWRIHAVCGNVPFVTRFFPFDLLEVLTQPLQRMGAAKASLEESVKQSKSVSTVKTVILAVLITVPLTVIVGALLAKADPGMETLFRNLGNLLSDNVIALILQAAAGIPAGFYLFGGWYGAGERRRAGFKSDAAYTESFARFRVIPSLAVYAGVTPVCVLYLLYVRSQAVYFFSAFAGRLPGDMIYSDYARRGFFELCAVAVINMIVLLVMSGCAKYAGRRPKMMTVYVTAICLFTLFIISTAVAKMALYIEAYGLTRQRLYTTWFMLLLAIAFICIIVRQFAERFPTAGVITGAVIVMFGVLCFSRPDALIAEYNISRYEQHTLSELDVSMLTKLSDDAYAVMMKKFDVIEQAGKYKTFEKAAKRRLDAYEDDPYQKWNVSAADFSANYALVTAQMEADYE